MPVVEGQMPAVLPPSDAPTSAVTPSVTPGEVLRDKFLVPLNLSAVVLAREIGVPTNCITAIVKGTRGITANTALKLSRRLGTSPEFWMHRQVAVDLEAERQKAEQAKSGE